MHICLQTKCFFVAQSPDSRCRGFVLSLGEGIYISLLLVIEIRGGGGGVFLEIVM